MSLAEKGYELHRKSDAEIRRYQIVGERCSGTNLLQVLCRRQFRTVGETNKFGWKHGFCQVNAACQSDFVIGVVRHPLTWVVSMYNRPWHTTSERQEMNFREFISSPWQTHVDAIEYFDYPDKDALNTPLIQDRNPITGEMFSNIFELRNAKAWSLLGWQHRLENTAFVRMETIVSGARDFFLEVAETFGVNEPDPNAKLKVKRRLGQKYRDDRSKISVSDLTADDITYIKSNLDPALEARLGYDLNTF